MDKSEDHYSNLFATCDAYEAGEISFEEFHQKIAELRKAKIERWRREQEETHETQTP
jgi:hypothetical protein